MIPQDPATATAIRACPTAILLLILVAVLGLVVAVAVLLADRVWSQQR
ncbi:MAG: hypothetical protein ACRDQI_16480 [Pseudonocardiaceae bacterium]